MIDRQTARPYVRSETTVGAIERDGRRLRMTIEVDAFRDGTESERVVLVEARGFGASRLEVDLADVAKLEELLTRAKASSARRRSRTGGA